ncbi:hypothetical protein [Phycicoccus sp. Soil803]|uniref:hypothetical protein n=1 Tax=Phycicoccus sp. Soil803 TaxID=1736415 RepID=UPI000710CCC0|nr:hypothetical protein [Phycicoccus sp. Soil803]KRF24842.1 hypothetical protein ASG95_10225 [Phycicoccus sp. Soil803]
MSTNLFRQLTTVSATFTVLALAGCGSTAAEDHQPEVSAPSTSASAARVSTSTSAAPTSVPQELTAEEQLRVNPPPPQRVSVSRDGAAVKLTWSPPPAVTVPHTYSDAVVEYRIYRTVAGGAERLVGTSATLTFTDAEPGAGTPRYAVSSVREHGVEGPRSDPVAAPAAS